MTTTPEATKQVPKIVGDPAPTLRADHNALADWIVANVDSSSATVGALPASGNWVGRKRYVVADKSWRFWDGAAWKIWMTDWITYTPTITAVAIGTGGSASASWKYKYINGDIRVRGASVLGTTGASVSGIPMLALPVNRAALKHPYEVVNGGAVLLDSSASTPYLAGLGGTSVSTIQFYPVASGPVASAISASAPFTWAAGDAISADFIYEPA